MSEYLFFIPIALALVIGVISPGPSFIFVAQVAMSQSRSQAIATSLGLGTGAMIFALVASLGLFFVLETVPWVYLSLKIMGGLYLFYLAYRIWNSAKQTLDKSAVEIPDANISLVKSYMLGLFTQLSNPKTAIVIGGIFMAFMPANVPAVSYILLAVMAFVIDAGWYSIVSIMLSTPKAQKVYLRFKKSITRVASGLMAVLGAKLIFNQ